MEAALKKAWDEDIAWEREAKRTFESGNELQPVEGVDPVSQAKAGHGRTQEPGVQLGEERHDDRIVDR